MQPYMPEETLKRMMLLENRIAELERELEAVIAELCVDCYQIYYDMVEAEELGDE